MYNVTDVNHANILDRRDIESFLDYYDGLKSDMDPETHDGDLCEWTQHDYDTTQELLDEYDEDAIEQLRRMVNDSRDDYFVSEDHWDDYAAEYADEMYNLINSGVADYFDYEKFAEDYKTDYTEYEYDGTSYYARD